MTTKLYDFPLNKSIKRLDFLPGTASNYVDCMPDVQRKILPYLAEHQAFENRFNPDVTLSNFEHVALTGPGSATQTLDLDEPYFYDGRMMGGYFMDIFSHPDAHVDEDEKVAEPDDIFSFLRPERQGDLNANPNNATIDSFRFSLMANDLRNMIAGSARVRRSYHPAAKYTAHAGVANAQSTLENQNIGFQGVWMYHHKKRFGSVYKDVYRTEFQDMVFRSNAKFFGDHTQREVLFYLPYNLEIGPWDEGGYAILRAVDYDGTDITESVRHPSGFLKMVLWNDQSNNVFHRPLHDNQGGGGYVRTDLELLNEHLRAVTLYLPIRRFAKSRFKNT